MGENIWRITEVLIVPLLAHLPVDCSGIDTLSWLSHHESSRQFLPMYQGTAEMPSKWDWNKKMSHFQTIYDIVHYILNVSNHFFSFLEKNIKSIRKKFTHSVVLNIHVNNNVLWEKKNYLAKVVAPSWKGPYKNLNWQN